MDPSDEEEVPKVQVIIVVVIWTWMEGNWWSIDAKEKRKETSNKCPFPGMHVSHIAGYIIFI